MSNNKQDLQDDGHVYSNSVRIRTLEDKLSKLSDDINILTSFLRIIYGEDYTIYKELQEANKISLPPFLSQKLMVDIVKMNGHLQEKYNEDIKEACKKDLKL